MYTVTGAHRGGGLDSTLIIHKTETGALSVEASTGRDGPAPTADAATAAATAAPTLSGGAAAPRAGSAVASADSGGGWDHAPAPVHWEVGTKYWEDETRISLPLPPVRIVTRMVGVLMIMATLYSVRVRLRAFGTPSRWSGYSPVPSRSE